MTPEQSRERAFHAQRALEEFVSPAVESLREEYLQALKHLAANEPWATDKIVKLAVAQRVIDVVEQQMRAIIAGGEAAQHQINRAAQLAAIPETKRNMLQRMGLTI